MKKTASSIRRRRTIALSCVAVFLTFCLVGAFLYANKATAGAIGPDVTVIYLPSVANHGSSGGIRAYSVGTTSCNIGDTPLWWCDNDTAFCDDTQHPVIAQNLYRLKDGSFRQIGMSWLKHGFLSLNTPDASCGSCQSPQHGGDQLGIGCTDAYGSILNGSRPLGLRSEVTAATGVFPFPATVVPSPSLIDQRIQVDETELDPALNAGARYWIEGQYVAPDDAEAGNGLNNASYREVTVSAGNFNLGVTGPTVRELPAIEAWTAVDPSVEIVEVDVPGAPVERFHVGRRATPGGGWHYEYAIHNMNSDRSARSFKVDFGGAVTITNPGFHDIDHHSGEPFATTDWTPVVDNGTGTIEWSTDTFAVDNNANAIRWGTTFSFWFDSEQGPGGLQHTLGLFSPGTPSEMMFGFPNAIFTDGFESGNTSLWSGTVSGP